MHGTSHHLGLDTHDYGLIDEPMKENMVFTVEPGVCDNISDSPNCISIILSVFTIVIIRYVPYIDIASRAIIEITIVPIAANLENFTNLLNL